MYPVSEAFMDAIERNTRKCNWTDTIVTKNNKEYAFCILGFYLPKSAGYSLSLQVRNYAEKKCQQYIYDFTP